jgi:hypothetical protein
MAMARSVRELLAFGVKRCTNCEAVKDVAEFHAARLGAGGVSAVCKACACDIRRQRYQGVAERQRLLVAAWAANNRERKRAANQAWRLANADRARETGRRSDLKRRSTPAGIIAHRVSVNVRQCLVRQGRTKGGKTFDALGYSPAELMAHLERQFVKGMSWENMGQWHIDHIIPLASFDMESLESDAFKRAWGLPNLRPMWGADNVRKHAKRETLL